jgi:hypothetical protein
MLASRTKRLLVIALAAATALGLLLYPTDEKRVRKAAEALVTAANESEVDLARALDQYAVPDVSVIVSDYAEPLQGRAALVNAAARARMAGQRLRFRMETVEISVEGSHARLNADMVASLSFGLRELKQARHGVALFEKRDGRFQLVSAEVGGERHDQPEARP